MFKKLFMVAASAVAGIYLTSEEGKNARKSLQKKKVAVEPIVKDLVQQANDVLAGTKELDSDEIRANVEMLVNEAKDSLVKLDLDKAAETIKDAIRVASRQIRDASNELEKEKRSAKKVAPKKQVTKKPVVKKDAASQPATAKPVTKTTAAKPATKKPTTKPATKKQAAKK